jgi:hypothetical protein
MPRKSKGPGGEPKSLYTNAWRKAFRGFTVQHLLTGTVPAGVVAWNPHAAPDLGNAPMFGDDVPYALASFPRLSEYYFLARYPAPFAGVIGEIAAEAALGQDGDPWRVEVARVLEEARRAAEEAGEAGEAGAAGALQCIAEMTAQCVEKHGEPWMRSRLAKATGRLDPAEGATVAREFLNQLARPSFDSTGMEVPPGAGAIEAQALYHVAQDVRPLAELWLDPAGYIARLNLVSPGDPPEATVIRVRRAVVTWRAWAFLNLDFCRAFEVLPDAERVALLAYVSRPNELNAGRLKETRNAEDSPRQRAAAAARAQTKEALAVRERAKHHARVADALTKRAYGEPDIAEAIAGEGNRGDSSAAVREIANELEVSESTVYRAKRRRPKRSKSQH